MGGLLESPLLLPYLHTTMDQMCHTLALFSTQCL
uniref:Macaca fascicularis brain cDNA clone: QflA-20090, similar to human vitamin K epoxide reductase complex, subunit 1(VKORC1), transcript variant 1, mRNA, RefSeq: NM_024006.4 n=1 Tax=Macaca fascicularis TaxID=9541 RepID=I7GCR3_MACFA|nr:unnamed protein product [Macaca fascicularis]